MGFTDITEQVETSRPALPQIYAYTTPELKRHDGWTKIGYTERDVRRRVWEQTHTADVEADIRWHEDAVYDHAEGEEPETFHDTDFHAYLRGLGVEQRRGTEWLRIEPEPAREDLEDFKRNHGVAGTGEAEAYELRSEQERAVAMTAAYARSHEDGEFLWNAKPRFGKTLATYDLCKRMGWRNVLVVTDRPAVATSWYSDYARFLGTGSGYAFVSETAALADRSKYPAVMSHDGFLRQIRESDEPLEKRIVFVSLQDLKGSIYAGGEIDKLGWMFSKRRSDGSFERGVDWDALVIDEAHEGVDTFKTDVAFDHLSRRFTLHLSGTPFKALANEKFAADAIFNWTYADEQKAKRDWPKDHPEERNPYEDLPQLHLFTYRMSDIVRDEAEEGVEIDGERKEYAFDLNEFFATKTNGAFKYDADVDRFLDALATQAKYPFSTPGLRAQLKHTFWILERVDSAKALARKLKKHPLFKDYEIVLAAGDGKLDDEKQALTAYERVCQAIASSPRTITLSVGQLTTGVTVPEWTAVLMLSNMKSPALYMQAAFRAQNPCLFKDPETGKTWWRKENCYVFDFDPARTLDIFEQFADNLDPSTAGGKGTSDDSKRHVRELLNFLPVLGEDPAGEMVELDAEQVLTIPRRMRSKEVVDSGFMSNYLFQNIANVLHAPQEVIDIIEKLEPSAEPKGRADLSDAHATASDVFLDADGNVSVPEETVIGEAQGLFGEKAWADSWEDMETDMDAAIDEMTAAGPSAQKASAAEKLAKRIGAAVAGPATAAAEQRYGSSLKQAQKTSVRKAITDDARSKIGRAIADYGIRSKQNEAERARELERAGTAEEKAEINERHDRAENEERAALNENLKTVSRDVVKQAARTVVREVETAEGKAKVEAVEESVSDHLRGFSRSIPAFLMAYGDQRPMLENFDRIVEPDVFEEATGITVDQFRFLRDGGDYLDKETGETRHWDGRNFDPVVFDDSVEEFLSLRDKLADYFDPGQKKDIFDYVPPQRTNQIFTPKRVVKRMVDLFEKENPRCFDNPEHTFADLYMKSGQFIAEIVTRLYNSEAMKRFYPDGGDRLKHIFGRQVFGAAPTRIIYLISTNYILGPDGRFSQGCKTHFAQKDTAALAKEGKLAEWADETFGPDLD